LRGSDETEKTTGVEVEVGVGVGVVVVVEVEVVVVVGVGIGVSIVVWDILVGRMLLLNHKTWPEVTKRMKPKQSHRP